MFKTIKYMKNITIFKILKSFVHILLISALLGSCGIYKKTDARKTPTQAKDKARDNLKTGKGASLNKILGGRRGGTNFEFSSSNPLWRSSLEILDFLPLTTVDYSGGVIITDWYNDTKSSNESIKVTIRFLSNEIRSDSVKIIVHKRTCGQTNNCRVNILNSKIKDELLTSILAKAVLMEKEPKKKN